MTTPYPITVYDTRPDGHNSLSVLPRLGPDDLEALQSFYKFDILYTHGYERAQPGELFWAITGFELKAGPAILQPQVWNQSGNLIKDVGILMCLHWPGAEPFPQIIDPPYAASGQLGFTENGCVGWGFGGESHIGGDGGPYTVWATSDPSGWTVRRVGSDAVDKLGWWDDHIIPNPIFQEMVKGGSEPPTTTKYLANVDATGRITDHILFIQGPPTPGNAGLVLLEDGKPTHWIAWTPRGV